MENIDYSWGVGSVIAMLLVVACLMFLPLGMGAVAPPSLPLVVLVPVLLEVAFITVQLSNFKVDTSIDKSIDVHGRVYRFCPCNKKIKLLNHIDAAEIGFCYMLQNLNISASHDAADKTP
ncbi:hypothetical protein L1987_65449 [Smallanthus sonchifolius]|uniref:Uncharacterized protein n=1 Tax=Smallanthus sonchifolius TaxID=185202 RepID=A0ACB9BUH5_9ASTR|nr:hypothetical protein L1987_65449 [Smallanthus sonchifolius]